MGIRLSFGVFFKSIEIEFSLTRAETAGIFSSYMVLCSISSVLGGLVLDRYGPRLVSISIGFFTGASLLLTSRVSSPWQLFISYSLLLSLGTGAVFAVVTSTVSRWFVKNRGFALGIAQSGGPLGAVAIAPLEIHEIVPAP